MQCRCAGMAGALCFEGDFGEEINRGKAQQRITQHSGTSLCLQTYLIVATTAIVPLKGSCAGACLYQSEMQAVESSEALLAGGCAQLR